ncbi:DODA-type extradiol aromatic ring-opening family dioxygenase [Kordiimonas pumila]|uniref:Protocatechuate 3,4-dioxygenase n=1 Tax=Kordiimonas pumila TaxID=2161677 RepID=A0ABV7D6M6_9PROT|nr:protocatechuate 3,4-dioxygenase [Kordiimonas pumila]
MAEIVLGIGCAHTPQLHTLAKDWDLRADRDRQDGIPLWFKGEKLKYKELEKMREAENLGALLGMETREEALRKSFLAMDRLHEIFVEAAPDVVVIIGNDQHEIFSGMIPTFAVIASETIENLPRTPEQNKRLPIGIELADHGHLPAEHTVYPGNRELGLHIAGHLVKESGFDVTLCHEKPTVKGDHSLLYGMPHAYGFLYKNIMRDHVVQHVPVDVNCWYYENSPTASRCYDFGVAVAKAIQAWDTDKRVAVLTTGGLTHFVVDKEWDHMFLDAMKKHDAETLKSIPQKELMAGTSECKSWIATSAVMDTVGLDMTVVDYQCLYRTEGGTGSSCAFTYWQA